MLRRVLFASPVLFLPLLSACSDGHADLSDSDRDAANAAYAQCVTSQTATLRTSASPIEAPKGPFSAALVAADPARASTLVRDSLKAGMRQSVAEARIGYLANQRCEHLKPPPPKRSGGMYAPTSMEDSAGSDNGGSGASQVSTTNNQVAGVDEADFIKNDSKYIYVANGTHFRIIEAWPATDAHEIANIPIDGEAKKLFVEGNRALVYSSVKTKDPQRNPDDYGYSGYGRSGECTYGQNGCVPSADGTETEISIFDITDRAAPTLVRSIHSSSSFIAARRIGNAVHTVLAQPQPSVPSYATTPNIATGQSEEAVDAAFAGLAKENAARIDALPIESTLPTWTDSNGAPETALYQSSMPDGSEFMSLLSLDLTNDANTRIASVIGRPGWVYASADALYLAVPHQQISGWGWYDGRNESELSTIHKFAIGTAPQTTAYVGTGVVKGRVLNQFAMDETNGFLRVATTSGHLPDPAAHNTVSVFEDQGGSLNVVGQIDQIAVGEDIRSVRFDGERGFIVTFKKTDPLFVFDLADPRAPKTLGELKIPGFSTYMHMMDATHLLTIGYDAADQGDFAYFTGMILQIFDVTNPQNPTLAHKESIGTRGSSSEAATNHLAFNYFAPKNLLALPMTICEGGDTNGNFGTQMTFSGLMVYDTTVANGFKLRGKVAHPPTIDERQAENPYGYYDASCSNWWSNASSEVKRSIFMDDYVFSVSTSRIKVNQLDNLAADVKVLSIE